MPEIKCPLCRVPVYLKTVGNTSMWVCDDCPFIGFEFWTYKDLESLVTYLLRDDR